MNLQNKNYVSVFSLILTISLTFSAFAQEPQNIQIITLPTGSKAYRVGVTLAAAINRTTEHKAIVAGYGGAQVIVPMLQNNRAEFALINSDDATQGYRGTGQFRRSNDNLRLISNAYDIYAGVVVAADSPIQSIKDIKGKRVTGIFSSHKSCALVAEAQMANMNLDRGEVRTVPVTNPISSVQAVADGRADVALCVSPGIPAALEANAKVGIRYISMDPSEAALERQRQIFNASSIVMKQAGSIPDISEDGHFLSYDYYLVSSSHVPDHIVEDVLSVLWDQHDSLANENQDFSAWTQQRMNFSQNPIPYHKAATQFFQSRGLNFSSR